MASDQPRTLVFSGTLPGEPGVGGVILKELQQELGAEHLDFCCLVRPQAIQLGWPERADGRVTVHPRRFETAWRPCRGVAGEWVALLARRLKYRPLCRQLVDKIVASPDAQACQQVWAVLDCPAAIDLASEVARRLGKPLSVMVWDAPELLIDQLQLDRWSAKRLLKQFDATIRRAERVGVIGEPMESAYRDRYGAKEFVILRLAIRESLPVVATPTAADQMRIGFAGSITSPQAFSSLVQMLDRCGWKIDGRAVTLRLIGSRYTVDARVPQRIEYFGWRSVTETTELLGECDVLYLPQPFAERLRPLAELSFPTKLSTYVAAGKRVLLHGPEYASIVPFLQRFPMGGVCHSLAPEDLQGALQATIDLDATRVARAIEAAREDEFNTRVFGQRFRRLLGWPHDSAAPPAATPPVRSQVIG